MGGGEEGRREGEGKTEGIEEEVSRRGERERALREERGRGGGGEEEGREEEVGREEEGGREGGGMTGKDPRGFGERLREGESGERVIPSQEEGMTGGEGGHGTDPLREKDAEGGELGILRLGDAGVEREKEGEAGVEQKRGRELHFWNLKKKSEGKAPMRVLPGSIKWVSRKLMREERGRGESAARL